MSLGYVAIVGKPNVGKSTFLNSIIQQKVAIVSPKPQTTRKQNIALYVDEDMKIIFIDNPGYHVPHNKLDIYLNWQMKSSLLLANVVLWFVDLTRPIDHEDQKIIETLKEYKIANVILVFTKLDLVSTARTNQYLNQLQSQLRMLHTIAINTHDVDNLQPLITLIKPFLQHDQLQQVQSTVENDKFVISEIIREQIIFNTKQELPYATGVTVEMLEYLKNKNLTNISAVIYVEKASQKPIVIGHGGEMIKKIGTIARKELLKVYNSKINLKLFVKVQSNWRDDEHFLQQMGYSNKK